MINRLVIQMLLSTFALFVLQSPAVHAAGNAAHVLRVGFVPGPYADEFREGVEPQLRRKGYTVQYVNFSTCATKPTRLIARPITLRIDTDSHKLTTASSTMKKTLPALTTIALLPVHPVG